MPDNAYPQLIGGTLETEGQIRSFCVAVSTFRANLSLIETWIFEWASLSRFLWHCGTRGQRVTRKIVLGVPPRPYVTLTHEINYDTIIRYSVYT
jgi:hypothetical protein